MEIENPNANAEGRDTSDTNGQTSQRLHRIGEIRRQQGVSVHCAARRMNLDVGDVQTQEEGDADIMLSTLYKWQQITLYTFTGDICATVVSSAANLVDFIDK